MKLEEMQAMLKVMKNMDGMEAHSATLEKEIAKMQENTKEAVVRRQVEWMSSVFEAVDLPDWMRPACDPYSGFTVHEMLEALLPIKDEEAHAAVETAIHTFESDKRYDMDYNGCIWNTERYASVAKRAAKLMMSADLGLTKNAVYDEATVGSWWDIKPEAGTYTQARLIVNRYAELLWQLVKETRAEEMLDGTITNTSHLAIPQVMAYFTDALRALATIAPIQSFEAEELVYILSNPFYHVSTGGLNPDFSWDNFENQVAKRITALNRVRKEGNGDNE